jgi:RNA polymerase sigma-32 factor
MVPRAKDDAADAGKGSGAEEPPEAVRAEVLPQGAAPAPGADDELELEGVLGLEEAEPADDAELARIAASLVRPSAEPGSTALVRRDPIDVYMAEVRKHPLLSREEEYDLAVRWVEHGDAAAARKLVTSNLRLVVKIAYEYRRAYQNLLDLVQEGNIGLVKAVQKFDPYRGVKLSTYAGWWIKAYILKYILGNWRIVKIGTTQNQRKLFFNLRKQRDALVAAGIEPTPEALAEALDVSEREVVEMERRMAAPDASLDAPLRSAGGEEGASRLDLLEDEQASPGDPIENAEFKHLLDEKLRVFGATLVAREREIFLERLMTEEPITLQELGERWNVSRERVRQLEKRMVLRLRDYLRKELGDTVQVALGHA